MDPQASPNPKQQIVERVRAANNVLVTVSTNPTVDQLAACIGLTLMLNKLDKHATAVFSGQIPSTIQFLRPEETIEKNTDSLRDFIISLDKSKADKLRYKVEDQVVRIFITPYRTSLSQSDLEFSQGDFNVDVVVALGVTQREQLDAAIVAHGRILHDATVVTITAGQATSDLGAINWQDPAASSLSEMLVSISEAFQGGLLDGQIATAFLTGIVAETERFSNPKTSPKVMTMSAQLMAAGANQQLIATELSTAFEPSGPPPSGPPPAAMPDAGTEVTTGPDGSLDIHHDNEPDASPPAAVPVEPPPQDNIHIDEHGMFMPLEGGGDTPSPPRDASFSGHEKVITPPGQGDEPPKTELSKLLAQEPEFGGTLTANSQDEDARPEGSSDPLSLPAPELPDMPEPPAMPAPGPVPGTPPSPPSSPTVDPNETLLQLERDLHSPHVETQGVDAARDAVTDAIKSMPYDAQRPEPVQSLNASPLDLPSSGLPSPDAFTGGIQLPPLPDPAAGPTAPQPDDHPGHGLLPMQPPMVSLDDAAPVDPLTASPAGGYPQES